MRWRGQKYSHSCRKEKKKKPTPNDENRWNNGEGHAIDLMIEYVAWRKNIHLHPISVCSWLGASRMHVNSQHGNRSFSAQCFVVTLPHLFAFPFLHLWAGAVPFNLFILLTSACVFFSRAPLPTRHGQNSSERFSPLKRGFLPWSPKCVHYNYIIWAFLNADLLKSLKSSLKCCLCNRPLFLWNICFSACWNREVRGGTPNITKTTILWPKPEYTNTQCTISKACHKNTVQVP